MCVNTFNNKQPALNCSWYKPLKTDILFQSVAFSSTSRMSTCFHLNLCSVLLCFKRFDSRSHFSTAMPAMPQCYAVTHFFLFPLKGTNIYLEEGSIWFLFNGLLSPCLAELTDSGQWQVIGAHRVGYNTGNGTENTTNVHSFRLLWQEWCFKINASVIALMNAHGRLAISMYSAQ